MLHRPGDAGVDVAQGAARFQRRPVVHLSFGHAGYRSLPRQHLEQHAAETVDVRPCIEIGQGHRLLRAHVAGGADRLSRLRQGEAAGGADRSRNPEVRDDRMIAREQDVLGLDIAVDDALRVCETQGIGDVPREMKRVFQRQPLLPHETMP